ncbi:MAG: MFS transporter, partial [Phycisphaerales bacterium]|nr:MFS transporter [Phycisphaerales bacterium]
SVAVASFTAPMFERRLGHLNMLWIGLLTQVIGIGLLYFVDDRVSLAIGMVIAGIGCAWSWAMPQAGAIKELPKEKVGLASGTIMTVMIMSGNTAIVISAMIIDLYPKTKIGEAAGIQSGFLMAALLAAVGLFSTLLILGRRTKKSQA